MKTLDYHDPSRGAKAPGRPPGFALALSAYLLGIVSAIVVIYGVVFLQDQMVGRVPCSHFRAWLYTAPPAAGMSLIGASLSIRMMRKRSAATTSGVIALVLNVLPFCVAIAAYRAC